MIEFFNIRSGERKFVETPEMIAAFYNSTDQHVNARVGQDMGWRIGASTIQRMNEIRRDQNVITRIAASFSLLPENVKDTDLLTWISLEDEENARRKNAQTEQDHQAEYEAELRALQEKHGVKEKSEAEKQAERDEKTARAAAKKQAEADKKAKAAEEKAAKQAETKQTQTDSGKIESQTSDKTQGE